MGDDFEREIVAPEIGQRARFEKQPLIAQFIGEIGGTRGAQDRKRAVGLSVHQINHGQPRRHLRACRALQPVIDLILQKIRSLIQQVDRDEAIGQAADHLVAAAADRRQLTKVVKQRQRLDWPKARRPCRQGTATRMSPPPGLRSGGSCRSPDAPPAALRIT